MNFYFFKRPKARQFDYKPLYYNPETEEAEERKKLRQELASDDPKVRMRAEMKRRWRKDKPAPDSRSTLIRIIFYLVFAGFAIYLIFFTDFVNKLVSLFVR